MPGSSCDFSDFVYFYMFTCSVITPISGVHPHLEFVAGSGKMRDLSDLLEFEICEKVRLRTDLQMLQTSVYIY